MIRLLAAAVLVLCGCEAAGPVDHDAAALAALDAGNLPEAARQYRLAVDAGPESSATHIALAQVLEQLGDFAAAVEHCDTAIGLDTANGDAWYLRARLYERAGDDQAAASAYAAAVERAPDAGAPRESLGAALMRLGQYEQAARHYAELLADGAGAPPRFLYLHALALIASGQCKAAREPLQRAYLADQTGTATAEALVRVRSTCAAGDEAERTGTVSLATELFHALPEATIAEALAMALAAAGDFDNAVQLQTRVVASGHGTAYSRELLQGFRRKEAAPVPWPGGAAAFRISGLDDSR